MPEDDLLGEQHPGDRGIERGGDSAGDTGGEQGAARGIGQIEAIAGCGGDAGAEIDDRALAPRARPAAKRKSAGKRAEQPLPQIEATAGIDPRLHDIRHRPGALGGEEILQHQPDQEAGDGRGNQDDPPRLGARGSRDVFRHGAEPRHLEGGDGEPEQDRRTARREADEGREQPHDGLPTLMEFLEIGDCPAPRRVEESRPCQSHCLS